MIKTLTDSNFEAEVLNSEKPVLVDFFATWCGPCKMLAPVLEELSDDYDGKVVFGKIDIDLNRAADTYGIQAVPTLMIFKGGKVVDTIVGLQPKAAFEQKLNALV